MSEVKLNLARKWRSKNFEEIIGQDLLVRMLKNGLYLQQYFPVYLFSGQRGCGKTTTARVFGSALNCETLSVFQKQPQQNHVPCLACASCKAMEEGKHPDFIEIDAASHTGVDNVRMLIDSASLLPLMGRKKIYLIDEAHMLSKAAFNALLKVLEEPPPSVIFILATTDPQKIIETVRSRCFQLFFKPVEGQTLHKRLCAICERENIVYDDTGLTMIVKHAEGSVRDALNLLEQIRFSSKSVTQDAVLRVLGYLDDRDVIALFSHVLSGEPQQLLQAISQMRWKNFSARSMWTQLLELVHTALWLKYDTIPVSFPEHHDGIKKLISHCSVKQLILFLEAMYDNELLFAKTTSKHDLLEMVLLQLCQRMKKTGPEGGSPSSAPQASVIADDSGIDDDIDDDELEDVDEEEIDDEEEDDEDSLSCQWKKFVTKINALDDPLMSSVFMQGKIKQFTVKTGRLEIEFSKDFVFFNDLLRSTQDSWFSLMQDVFGEMVTFVPLFTGAPLPKHKKEITTPENMQPKRPIITPSQQPSIKHKGRKRSFVQYGRGQYKPFAHEAMIDISDTDVWRKTHMILHHIPGTITEVRG